MGLSEIDRHLLDRCLHHAPRAWEDFCDRFLGLVLHVIQHTAQAWNVRLAPEDRDDLSAEVFFEFLRNDYALLRNFRGGSSLATYLTVVTRRVVVRELLARKVLQADSAQLLDQAAAEEPGPEQRLSDREEVSQLLARLDGPEAEVVRLFHLEGKSYREIGEKVGMPENSIGPILSRARGKLRRVSNEKVG